MESGALDAFVKKQQFNSGWRTLSSSRNTPNC
jgi:hypothetical protein